MTAQRTLREAKPASPRVAPTHGFEAAGAAWVNKLTWAQ